MEKLKKKEFIEIAKNGVYYFKALWTKEENCMATVIDYLNHIKEIEKYKSLDVYRIMDNNSMSIRFVKNDESHSYMNVSGANCSIYRYGNFYIIHTIYSQVKKAKDINNSIVIYIDKDAKDKKEIQINPELFIEELPHGSGIDCNWEYIEHKNGKVTFKNWFHAMDEHGGYDRYMPFKFTVFYDSLKNQFDFTEIVCNENRRKSFFGLKEYLNDIIYICVVGNIDPNKHIKP